VSVLRLARWLGPWADATKAPDVEVSETVEAGTRVRLYGRGSPYLIAPGLHYAGPDDPRMDRFCRVLASAGHLVIAPFVRDYLALVPCARAIADFRAVYDACDRPTIFSISFGSLLAFAVAAERDVERLVIFGGYADFHETMRYCLTGEGRDPLNQPVVLMNLLDYIDHDRAHTGALVAGWRRYVERTWGRPELKAPERYSAIADELAPDVPAPVRELFLAGIRPGAWSIAEPALAKFDARALDPRPYLSRVKAHVDLVHGTDDDVIPYTQSQALAAQLPNAHVHITGMYGHTGATMSKLAALPRELATMYRVLRVLAR
jgi:pimeloyl-ACP methyl ester carboxylesterase